MVVSFCQQLFAIKITKAHYKQMISHTHTHTSTRGMDMNMKRDRVTYARRFPLSPN